MYRFTGVVLALSACLAWSTVAGAAVYRWVDQKGEVHYGDVPAPGAQSIDTRTWTPSRPAQESPPADTPPPADQAAPPAADKGASMSRAEKCKLAQKQFTQYRSATKLVRRDQFGAEHTLSDEERAQVVKQAKANVDKYCGAEVAGG